MTEIRIATVNIYIDMPTPVFDGLLSYLEERGRTVETPSPEASSPPSPAPDHALLLAQLKEKMEQLRYRTTQPIRTGPRPEPTAHDLIMQMEGSDEDYLEGEVPPWMDEWPDEAAISLGRTGNKADETLTADDLR